jgi:adenosylmethionine-8-amino-7-oxononanoate aminotransferase
MTNKVISKVLGRSCNTNLPTVDYGDGVYIFDKSGKKYLDGCGGAAVSCLGHNNLEVKNAISQQLQKIPYAHTSFFTNDPQEQLAQNLVENAYGDFRSVYFVSGGSEAVETALKLARQYFVEIGKVEKKYIIARKQSYHGNTIGALSAGGNLWRKEQFEPILISGNYISPCYEYRDKKDSETSFEYGQRVAGELEDKILELGVENVAAFIAEPVVGATAGALVATRGYFKKIREICDKYGVLLILDEVMCGMGRTGTLHACEQEEVKPDLQTLAKGIAGGYQALGATLVSEKIHNAICDGSGMFQHGHTYIGHPLSCSAGLAVQEYILQNNILDNVCKQGKYLKDNLSEIAKNHNFIGDVRGRGLFVGLELVQDKISKTPFDYKLKTHAKIKKNAMDLGLMIYPMGGTIDGKNGDHILLAPPFIIDKNQIDELIEKLILSIDKSIAL